MPPSTQDRLESWKEIADFIQKDQRTAMRWAEQGMPVRRFPGGSIRRIYASRIEIAEWLSNRTGDPRWLESAQKAQNLITTPGPTPSTSQPSLLSDLQPRSATTLAARLRLSPWEWIAVTLAAIAAALAFTARLANSDSPPTYPHITALAQLSNDGLRKERLRRGGNFLFFNEPVGGQHIIASIPISGGAVHRMISPFPNTILLDASADGSRLLVIPRTGVEIDDPLWILPTDGSAPTPVGRILCHEAAWSGDSRRIAFAHETTLSVAATDGTGVRDLAEAKGLLESLSWSPDNSQIEYGVRSDVARFWSEWEVTSQSANGIQNPTRLSGWSVPEDCCFQTLWTPRRELVASAFRGVDNLEIWIASLGLAGNPQPRPIVKDSVNLLEGFAPAHDPSILYALVSPPARGELIRFDSQSGEFAEYIPGLSGRYLSFSPDRQWITYVRSVDSTLWRSRLDGSDPLQLTNDPSADVELPRFSPDGARIAFISQSANQPWRIFIVGRAGGRPQAAFEGPEGQGAATWAPDGKELLFGNVDCQQSHACAVHILNLGTHNVRTVPGSSGLRTPRWSPDGRFIAALQPESGELCLFDFRTNRWQRLLDGVYGDDINWSTDSRFIYVDSPQSQRPLVQRYDLLARRAEPVVSIERFRNMLGNMEIWFGLAPDNSPIFFRRLDSSEVFRLDWSRN